MSTSHDSEKGDSAEDFRDTTVDLSNNVNAKYEILGFTSLSRTKEIYIILFTGYRTPFTESPMTSYSLKSMHLQRRKT